MQLRILLARLTPLLWLTKYSKPLIRWLELQGAAATRGQDSDDSKVRIPPLEIFCPDQLSQNLFCLSGSWKGQKQSTNPCPRVAATVRISRFQCLNHACVREDWIFPHLEWSSRCRLASSAPCLPLHWNPAPRQSLAAPRPADARGPHSPRRQPPWPWQWPTPLSRGCPARRPSRRHARRPRARRWGTRIAALSAAPPISSPEPRSLKVIVMIDNVAK